MTLRPRLCGRRAAGPLAALALALATCAAPAAGSVTIGELAPGTITSCSAGFEFLQHSSPGNTHAMPAAGVITSWAHRSQVGTGQTPTLKVYRKTGDPAVYQVVGRDGPEPITANTVASFPASVAVQKGDVLGVTGAGGANIGCRFTAPGEDAFRPGNLADGAFDGFTIGGPNNRVNVSAVLDPTNSFTLGKPNRNSKQGTATLTANVPNPGQLTVSGKGVRASSGAVISKQVSAAGPVKLKVRAKGKQRRKLSESGKVTLKLAITFTPTGGDPSTQTRKLKLRKNL